MILSMELSSKRGSVALFDGQRVLAQEVWDEPGARHPALFPAVPRILQQAGVAWEQLLGIAAGRGPGAFSGVRVALMAAQTFALPCNTPVFAFSSGKALALDLCDEAGNRPIVIAGDARRGSIWRAIFAADASGVKTISEWDLIPAAGFCQHLPDKAFVASPDWTRLASACGHLDPRFHWINEDRYPSATRIAELAWHSLSTSQPGESLTPLYLHPAV